MGVGDLSVGKKMRKLGEAFYGRAKAYQAALEADDHTAVAALIGRTVYEGKEDATADRLADYVQRSAAICWRRFVWMTGPGGPDLAWPEIVL